MLYAPRSARLEIRAEADGSRIVTGRFPYNDLATLSDGGRNGGRPKKERFRPGAFKYRLDDPDADIDFLLGHDYSKPLASRATGTLAFMDSQESLQMEARITSEVAETTHAKDALALIGSGLAVGLSPGFRIPPQRTVENAVETEEEDPSQGTAVIRNINQALLYELSLVTKPAYKNAEVEARSWKLPPDGWFVKSATYL